ncbi:MAG: CapA family protein [Micromonosporaceae bacterium]|nr:CapA family protein [Micromonosporaceae bacterium]
MRTARGWPVPASASLGATCLLVLAACGDPPDRALWHEPGTPASASAPAIAAPTATPGPPPELTLAFAGDVHFTDRTRDLLADPETALGPFAPMLRAADFAMLNLETAVTDRGTPEPKTYHFRAPPTAYQALQAAGVDLVSLANNHALDYGQVGLADTLAAARDAGMAYVGAGRDATAAYAPHLTTVAGVRLAVLGFSQVHELAESWQATGSRAGIAMAFDTDRVTGAVARARAAADLVIVYLHWGREGDSCPTGEMRDAAELLAGAGADIVLGTHAHVLLADGWLDGTYVHWGLGNFVWWGDSHSTDTGVLLLTVRDGRMADVDFRPGMVSGTGQPVPVDGADRDRLRQRLDAAADCAGLAPAPGR